DVTQDADFGRRAGVSLEPAAQLRYAPDELLDQELHQAGWTPAGSQMLKVLPAARVPAPQVAPMAETGAAARAGSVSRLGRGSASVLSVSIIWSSVRAGASAALLQVMRSCTLARAFSCDERVRE
ncbi:MAG TPA: hypothetical protein VFG86_17510, partial [Chloroflexota bacterium]|nr:hypothetical protein [Chloroflexota bacterium]